MREKISKDEFCSLITSWLSVNSEITPSNNWYNWFEGTEKISVYVSQCKPSAYSKGSWYYEFFHTLSSKTIDRTLSDESKIILVDYATRKYAVLDTKDIEWVYKNSSRTKKKGGLVTDVVVRLSGSQYYLEPGLAGTRMYRNIEVIKFQ